MVLCNQFRLAGFGTNEGTPELSFYSARCRNYHPGLGRWIERDPEGYVDGMSLNQYCLSNPTGMTDPTGLLGDPNDEWSSNANENTNAGSNANAWTEAEFQEWMAEDGGGSSGSQGVATLNYGTGLLSYAAGWASRLYDSEINRSPEGVAAEFFLGKWAGGGSQTINFKEGDNFLEMVKGDPFIAQKREFIQNELGAFAVCAMPGAELSGTFTHDYGTTTGQPRLLEAGRDALYAASLYGPPALDAMGTIAGAGGTLLDTMGTTAGVEGTLLKGLGYFGSLISEGCHDLARVGEWGQVILPMLGATKTSAVLGRYDGTWDVDAGSVDPIARTATVNMHVKDFWNAESLTGFLGPGAVKQSPFGDNGPMGGKINLNFDWKENVKF